MFSGKELFTRVCQLVIIQRPVFANPPGFAFRPVRITGWVHTNSVFNSVTMVTDVSDPCYWLKGFEDIFYFCIRLVNISSGEILNSIL